MKDKIIKITKEQTTSIFKYLEGRLGVYGITWFDFEEQLNDNGEIIATQNIKSKFLGITKFIIEECELYVRIFPQHKIEHGIQNGIVWVSLQYKHHGGGSNGYDLNFKLTFNNSVYEVAV